MSSEVKLYDPCETMPGAMRECEDGGFCQASDYAALEAENARLVEQLEQARKGFPAMVEYVEEIAQLRAQLAAIQQAKGEVIEPCTDLNHHERYRAGWNACLAQHQRITAAMAAEVERLRGELYLAMKVPSVAAMHTFLETEVAKQNVQLGSERDALRAELAAVKGQEAVAWMPIETAPCDGRLALVYRPLARNSNDEPVAVKRLIGGNNHCWESTVPNGAKPTNPTDGGCHATHWMPFPEPPGEQISTTRPASPDVEGLVKALELYLQTVSSRDANRDVVSQRRRELASALSTWREAHP